jgi:LysM repeat protein
VPAVTTRDSGPARRCPSCGSRVQSGSKVCAICGAPVPWRWTRPGVLVESALIVAAVTVAGFALAWARGTGRHLLSPEERVAQMEVIDRVPTEVPTHLPAADPLATAADIGPGAAAAITTTRGVSEPGPGTLAAPAEPLEGPSSGQEEPPSAAQAEQPAQAIAVPTSAGEGAGAPDDAAAGEPVVVAQAETHEVKSGDTLGGIAARYGVPLDDLLELNADWLTSLNQTLQVGDQVVVKAAAVVTATVEPVAEATATTPPVAVLAGMVPGLEDLRPTAEVQLRAPAVLGPGPDAAVTTYDVWLRWASVGVLPRGVAYVVSVRDSQADPKDADLTWVSTNATALRVPSQYRPPLGSSRSLVWTVDVRRRSGRMMDRQGTLLCPEPTPSTFTWSPGG